MVVVERGGAAVSLGLVDVVFLGCRRGLGFGKKRQEDGCHQPCSQTTFAVECEPGNEADSA